MMQNRLTILLCEG